MPHRSDFAGLFCRVPLCDALSSAELPEKKGPGIGPISKKPYFEHFSFGDGPEMADELLERSFSGKKTATVPVVPESEPVPKAGGLSLVLDGKGEPACVIRKVSIEGIPYGSLTWDKIRPKGEDEIELALYADGNGNKL